MKNEDVTQMEKLCFEAQLKVEEAGRILCPETGAVAGYIRGELYKVIADIEYLIQHCYVLRDLVTPPTENTEEIPDEDKGEEEK